MKTLRLAKGIFFVLVYYTLYYPAQAADKFSSWFWRWDFETFGL